jgi:hypothetical protein
VDNISNKAAEQGLMTTAIDTCSANSTGLRIDKKM